MPEISKLRKNFPGLRSEWVLMDNAGGSQIAREVLDRIQDYLIHTNAQLGASYGVSQAATERVQEAHRILAGFIGTQDPAELVLGSSTSYLIRTLAGSIGRHFPKGGEIIVTNCDHEANIGAWRELEHKGFTIKTWKINPETWELDLEDLRSLLTEQTRLVAFTHTSNILGKINPVKEITQLVHDHGAWVCVDAVAYAPHRQILVKEWDVDFYVFSFYKTYGPHYALLYGKKEHLLSLPGNNHYFIGPEETAYKFQPGNVNYELSWGAAGIVDYFTKLQLELNSSSAPGDLKDAYRFISAQEQELAKPLIDFLQTKKSVRIIGPETADQIIRVPTLSFTVKNTDSQSIVLETDKHKIGIRYGDFYAARLIDDLGLRWQNGVVRISMVHYNSLEEVHKLISVLDPIIPSSI